MKTVSVTYGRKTNLGDYCSLDVSCSLWADIDSENLADSMAELWAMVKNNVMTQVLLASKEQKLQAKATELFLGLPSELKQIVEEQED